MSACPQLIGIADLARPDYGDAVPVERRRAAGVLGLRGDAAVGDRGGAARRSRSRTRRARCSSPISRTAASRSSSPATGEPDEDDQAPHRRVRGRRRPRRRAASLQAQGALPAGPKVKVVMVTQPGPGLPQYTTVDIPMLREGVPKTIGRAHRDRARELAGAQPQRPRDHPPRPLGPGRYRRRAAGDDVRRRAVPRHRRPRRPQPDRSSGAQGRRGAGAARPTRSSSASTPASSPCIRSRRRCCSAASRSPASTMSRAEGPHQRRLAQRLHVRDRWPAGRHRLPRGLRRARARRRRLRRHRHRVRQRRPLVRSDEEHVRPAARLGDRRPTTSTSTGGTSSTRGPRLPRARP